ncbi:MAG: hypothetical protein RLN76_02495 [Phycisphaeraceae bacterium]
MTTPPAASIQPTRLLSLDVYRGFIMLLLMGEGAGVYYALHEFENPIIQAIATQFTHPPSGLSFWDTIQPGFMFIVGVAMAFSIRSRRAKGVSWGRLTGHFVKRSIILLLLGAGLHCFYAMSLVWELWNVLCQLSVTILIAFAIYRLPVWSQFVISLLLILATDLAYRFIHIAPYDQTFVLGSNFGTYVDTLVMGTTNSDGWVALNAIPTAAHTIWGVLAGKLLIAEPSATRRVVMLAGLGVLGIIVGYAMAALDIAPIIKRISTSSFVIVSGGWCVLALALFHAAIDLTGWRRGLGFLVVVGLNPITIYMITEALAYGWLRPRVGIFTEGFLGPIGLAGAALTLTTACVTWFVLWFITWWLDRHRIYIRI